MPLPDPAPRTPMHTRRVTYQGYRRDDGLWEIEGELHDSKPHDIQIHGNTWVAREPIHHMRIRVTFDQAMVIHGIAVAMEAFPHAPCPEAMPAMQRMVGEVLGRGWRQTIQRHLGTVEGCTHLRELLFNLATAAFQTCSGAFGPRDDGLPPTHLGQCKGWDFNGPVVEREYPMFFRWRPPEKKAVST